MVKTKILSIVLCFVLLIGLICLLACCEDGRIKVEKRYDMVVMIARMDVQQRVATDERWIVPANQKYIDIEQEYDGKQYKYFVCAYNFPNHPDFGDVWFDARNTRKGLARFAYNSYRKKADYYWYEGYDSICEIGEYTTIIYALKQSKLWKPKGIELHITIK